MTPKPKRPIDSHLRAVMAGPGMFQTTELLAPLREQGVDLSREQVCRFATRSPERLNVEVLAALCGIFGCQLNDLITATAQPAAAWTTGTTRGRNAAIGDLRPVCARLHHSADLGR